MEHINFEKYEVNQETRQITFSVCSDNPYVRYDQQHDIEYEQILVINENSVILDRLKNYAPVLFNHDPNQLLGVVQDAYILGNKVFVKVKFSSNSEFADRIYKDMLQGTCRNVSIGYQIQHYYDVKENGINRRYVDKFMIFECSTVSIPADDTCGIRNLQPINNKEYNMEDNKQQKQENVQQLVVNDTPTENIQQKPVEQKNCDQELKRLKEQNEELKCKIKALQEQEDKKEQEQKIDETEQIKSLGRDFKVPTDEVDKAIKDKISVRDFKEKIKNLNFNLKNKETKNMNVKQEFRDYITAGNFDKPFNFRTFEGFGGLTGQGGESLIGTQTLPLVQILEKRMGVKGYRVLSGLTSNISIPVQTTRNTAYITDNLRDAVTESNPAFTPVVLTPHKIGGACEIGKELLTQVNDDIISFVIDSLLKEISYSIQSLMLDKVVAANPTQINYSSLASIDWNDVLAFEKAVAGYNLDPATLSYVMSPAARAALKGVPLVANYPKFLCENNEINGYRCDVSGCVGNDNIYFGDWSKLILALFDRGQGMSVIIDPFTKAKQGNIIVVASVCVDAAVEQAGAFAIGKVQSSSTSSASSSSL